MKHSLVIFAFILVLSVECPAGQNSSPRPSATPHLGRQNGLFDALKGAGSSQRVDYGQCIEEGRQLLISNTLKSYEFIVTVVALGLTGVLFLYVLCLDTKRRQTLISTAELVAKYQNQLSTGQRAYQRLQDEYSKFLTDFELEREPRLATKPPHQKARNADDDRGAAGDSANKVAQPGSQVPGSPQTTEPSASLRQQITILTRQLDVERQKNRKLQGG